MTNKSRRWFKKVRGSYIPNSWQGWLSYLPYLGYLLAVYFYVMMTFGYSPLSFLIIIPNWLAAVAVMSWFAARHSR